jgi:stalled ribosome rescue protein Dom34
MGLFDRVTEKIQKTKTSIRPKFMSVSEEEIKKYLAGGEALVATITQAVATSAKTILFSNERLIVFESGIMKSSFKDYYFRDIKDVKFETSAFCGGTITINADKGNNAGITIT